LREEISVALFDRLSECTSFKTKGRRLPGADEVPGSAQPAFFLGSPTESYGWSTRGGDPLRRLTFTAWVYCFADGAHNAIPSTQINNVLDAFEAALQPDPLRDIRGEGERCTLGGLVFDCRIEGNIDTDEGLLGPQGFARIPIIVVIP
jgi:hypothetical protein